MNKYEKRVIVDFFGEDVYNLVRKLGFDRLVSEYKLADQLNLDINTTRNLLYKLLKYNLVSFKKEKDKLKGWYIYHWQLDKNKFYSFIIKSLERKVSTLQTQISKEESQTYFICENKCVRLTFDQALNFNFKCPECGSLLKEDNGKGRIQKLKQEIEDLNLIIQELKTKFSLFKKEQVVKKGKKTNKRLRVKSKQVKKSSSRGKKSKKKAKSTKSKTTKTSHSKYTNKKGSKKRNVKRKR